MPIHKLDENQDSAKISESVETIEKVRDQFEELIRNANNGKEYELIMQKLTSTH